MDRRVGGGLMIGLALVSVLTVPRLLNPSLVTGAAAVAPPPPAPSIGDCLVDPVPSAGFDASGVPVPVDDVVFVPCTDAHRGEIIFVNPDFQPAPYNAGQPFGGFDDPCTNPARSDLTYLGLDATAPRLWEPALATTTSVLGPDSRQLAAGQEWAACVLNVGDRVTLTDTLRGVLDRDGAPRALAVCFTGTVTEPMRRPALCSGPHTLELLGAQTLDIDDPVSQETLDRGCPAVVAAAAGRPLDAEPDLEVTTLTYAYDSESAAPTRVRAPLPADADGGWSDCVVRGADGRRLNGSVRQLGAAPLPWAP